MKTLIRLTLAALLALTMACSSDDEPTAETVEDEPSTSTTATETTSTTAPRETSTSSTTEATTTTAAGPPFLDSQTVLDEMAAAGLSPPNVRDNTVGNCGGADGLQCSTWTTSDILTVIEWDTADDAVTWTEGPLSAVLVGERTTVHFQEGGTTPAYDRPAYDQVLADLNAG